MRNPGGGKRTPGRPTALGLLILTITLLTASLSPAAERPAAAARADSLWQAGEGEAAVSLVEKELTLARAANDSGLVANMLVMKGTLANFRGYSKEAESVLREGIALARARRDSVLLMTGVRWLSVAVGSQGRRAEAMELYHELLTLGVVLGDRRHQGWARVGMAWGQWRGGEADSALANYERAATLFPGTGDVEGELWANNGIAAVNNDLGRYDEASEGYLSVIEVARAHGLSMPEAVALNNLGTLEFSLGRSDVALGHFRMADELHSLRENPRPRIATLLNIALCLNTLGQGRAAREVLDEALAICEERGYQDYRSRVLVKIASMELHQGRLHQAGRLIQDAMGDPDNMMVRDVVEARIELGEAYRKQEDFPAAARQFALADSLLGEKSFTWVRMRLMGHQAQVFRSQGKTQLALDQFLALAEMAADRGIPEFRHRALADAAHTCILLERPDTAKSLFAEAATAWEEDRRLLLSPEWRERRGASGREIFTDLAAMIHQDGDIAAAFDHLQSYKARTLLERMVGPGEKFAKFLSDSTASNASLEDVQKELLDEDELLLDFTLGPRVSLLFAVTRDTVLMQTLPPAAEIENRARAYHDLLKSPDAGSPEALAVVGAGLADLLLGNLPSSCWAKGRILVAPDGALNLLPFAELEIPGRSPVWTRIPSASVILNLRRDSGGKVREEVWRTLAVASGWGGDSSHLPGTLREVENLSRGFRRVEARILSERDTELPSLSGFDILHLAAHASQDDQSPWQSAIHFLPEDRGGSMRAADILDQRLDAGLAILSSCGSGTGKILNGEGVLGLSNAFLSAGVPAVLASLWAVDDGATSLFMDLFYGFLAEGQDCARALAYAQGEMRRHPATSHPFYWAGFVLIGDGSVEPHLEVRGDRMLEAASGLLVVTLAGAMFLRRRSRSPAGN